MDRFPEKQVTIDFFKAVWPAFAAQAVILLVPLFFQEFSLQSGTRSVWMVIFRFLRLSVFLLVPILFLRRILALAGSLFQIGARELVQIRQESMEKISPLKNWLLRPLQGIGVSMLVATKLIVLLEIYSGEGIAASVFLPPPMFSLQRFFVTAAMAFAVSLVLSSLWTLEDLGIRLYNRKTREIRKIGKYFGLILPLVLGFYGLMSLSHTHATAMAIRYFIMMAMILYPPFLILNVFHAFYINRNENRLLTVLRVKAKMAL